MNYEIHIFLGEGKQVDDISSFNAFMLFIRANSNSEYNMDNAVQIANDCGFTNCEFKKSGKLTEQPLKADFIEPYKNALTDGSSIIVYNE